MALPEFAHSSPDAIQQQTAAASPQTDQGVTADTKYGKEEVNYRPAGSSNTRCERCRNFKWSAGAAGTGSCRIVAGLIKPDYVCDKFDGGGSGLMDLVTGEPTR